MHFGVKDEVLSDIHDLGCTVDIPENFRLSGEPLGPVPFLHQLLVPEVPIDFAFGVDAAAWVAIVMPNAPNIFRGFDAKHPITHLAEPISLIEPGQSCTNHYGVKVKFGCH